MTSSRLNEDIINNRYALFVGAGASAPLGLKPTGPFLELLPKKIDKFIQQDYRKEFGEENVTNFLDGLFTEAVQHFKVDLPDSEIVLDYLNFLAEVCRQMAKLPEQFKELAGQAHSIPNGLICFQDYSAIFKQS